MYDVQEQVKLSFSEGVRFLHHLTRKKNKVTFWSDGNVL